MSKSTLIASLLILILFLSSPEICCQEINPVCDNLLQSGQLETALDCFLKEHEKYPDHPLINLHICRLLEADGQLHKMGPYLAKIDTASAEAQTFLEYLSANYARLKIELSGKVICPVYFGVKTKIEFAPPVDLAASKMKRLSYINENLSNSGNFMFRKQGKETGITEIPYFPIITEAPLPYAVEFTDDSYSFNLNFMTQEALRIDAESFDSIYCIVPDDMVEIQLEIDDPDFEVAFRMPEIADSSIIKFDQNRYLVKEGEMPVIYYQKKGRPALNKKYFITTSAILTAVMLLLQR
jgi:hypothetical protein